MLSIRTVACIVTGIAVLAPAGVAADGEAPSKSHEQRVRAAIAKAMPSVVAIEGGIAQPKNGHYEAFGSGVIVSPDGLVVSQHHVTHMSDYADQSRMLKPGNKVRVILHNGRECRAELLGTDRAADLSMLKILDPGPFPFSPLDAKVAVALGDDVMKLGHPRGYRAGRPPVTRLGRVLARSESYFVSDCQVNGGDSGGPFFDLDGRLMGIIQGEALTESLQRAKAHSRMQFKLVGTWSNAFVAARFDSLRKGVVTTDVGPARPLDGRNPLPKDAKILLPDRWMQGRVALEGWRATVAEARKGVVTILDGGVPVALGTVVEPGLVVTKASLLPPAPRCRLGDGRVVVAEVLGGDAAWDLALLKVDAGLKPVAWAAGPDAPAGSLLAAAGPGELPLAVGIVSVARRKLEGPFPAKIVPTPPLLAARPEAIGSTVEGRGYWVEYVEGPLADAGVRPGDVLLSVLGVPIRGYADLAKCVRGRRAGEAVPVRVQRGREVLDLTMVPRVDPSSMSSGRDDDFPEVFEHNLPVEANESGAPLIDREGKVVGVTIAVNAVGGMAIPGDRVRAVVAKLRDGKTPWPGERARAAAPKVAPAGEPVTLPLDELKAKLAERAGRFSGLMVEYDAVTEANVPPGRMVAWSMVVVRDYRERCLVAFDGAKRLSRVTIPGDQPRWLPGEEVVPDPNAPPEQARQIVEQAKAAAARKSRGNPNRLVAVKAPSENRILFDGERCFRWDEASKQFRVWRAGDFSITDSYLENQGLQPIDPESTPERRAAQEASRLPDLLAHTAKARVLAGTQLVGGAACVVLEAESRRFVNGTPQNLSETIWFDPKLGYAVRKWEKKVGDRLVTSAVNSDFDEFAPGCWLPWESELGVGPPAWVAAEFHGRPAYTVRMRLRKARVGDLPAEWFRP